MNADYSLAPPRRSLLRFLHDRNPCYLLSGVCMLAGCHLLNSALYTPAGDVRKLITLLGVLNVYELMLVGLGLLLIRHPTFRRDGRMLLALEALFLSDITFTAGIISTIDAHIGLLLNLALLTLAGAKAAVVLRVLKVPGTVGFWIMFMVQSALVLGTPTLFKQLAVPHHGRISPLTVYASWWAAGLVPVMGLLMYRLFRKQNSHRPEREMGVALVFLCLPFASLLVHLYSAGWVYSIDFTPVSLSPVALGLAAGAFVLKDRLPRITLMRLQMVLVGVAVMLSLHFPGSLLFEVRHMAVSPLRLVLATSGLLAAYGLWEYRYLNLLYLAVAAVLLALLGPSPATIVARFAELVQSLAILSQKLVPRTTMHWGILSIAAAFALLMVGAMLSVRKARMACEEQAAGSPLQ